MNTQGAASDDGVVYTAYMRARTDGNGANQGPVSADFVVRAKRCSPPVVRTATVHTITVNVGDPT